MTKRDYLLSRAKAEACDCIYFDLFRHSEDFSDNRLQAIINHAFICEECDDYEQYKLPVI